MKKNYLILTLFLSIFLFIFSFNSGLTDQSKKKKTFDQKEMVDKAKIYFADLSEGVGIIIERSFMDFGQPSAYIEGEEYSGAFFGGFRYGGGKIYFKDGTIKDIFWNGPSLGFDLGANASKVFTLVYNLEVDNFNKLLGRYPEVEGTLYLAAGLAINYQKKDDIIITPVRSGLGLRAGVNLGYSKYTEKKSFIPF
ncbi:MAG: DUF1134 domain-containing protein [Alphaproteobacteria bacterium]|nr:DUF1134 domain-containing protein [Alphaproteobacteria bacterium]|tara:strand:- start:277 stop:861 length:585 start_codon:yes stop_codon:yes gene_type:complete